MISSLTAVLLLVILALGTVVGYLALRCQRLGHELSDLEAGWRRITDALSASQRMCKTMDIVLATQDGWNSARLSRIQPRLRIVHIPTDVREEEAYAELEELGFQILSEHEDEQTSTTWAVVSARHT